MENAGVFLVSKESALVLLTIIFTFVSLAFFIKDFRNHNKQPYVWAWATRLAICVVALCGQLAQGATYSLALTFSQLLCGVCIIGLSLRAGGGKGRLDAVDWLALGIAGIGGMFWVVSGESLYGLFGVLVADACATIMGVRAAAKTRSRESVPFWGWAFLAACTALLSAGSASWAVLLVPVFSCVNALVNIFAAIYFGGVSARSAVAQAADAE